ncbi:hypothetical protein IAS59_006568 [Cryptococcus gattii]
MCSSGCMCIDRRRRSRWVARSFTSENSLPTALLQLSLYPTSATMMPLLKGDWQEGLLAAEEKRKLLNSWLHRTWSSAYPAT